MKARNIPHQPKWGGHVSTQNYALGYVLSLILTIAAFLLVWKQLLSGRSLGLALFALCIVQVWVQLSTYFNLGKEPKPRWNLLAFYFTVLVLIIVVVGTLIIMANLDYRMMP